MKKIFATCIMSLASASVLLTSCADELDSDKYFEDRKTLETVFTSRQQSEEWLAYAYSFMTNELADVIGKGNGHYHCFADDMYYGDRDPQYGDDGEYRHTYNAFKLGEYDEDTGYWAWEKAYKGIFQASVFIHNIDKNPQMTEEERIDRKGQARFARAYYYWLLLRKYGPVPIMPDDGVDYTQNYEAVSIPRSTYEECAVYIATEMEQAAKEIQYWKRDPLNIVRPTKGACLAARALAYVYAASPLANGQLKNGKHDPAVKDDIAKLLTNFDGTHLLSLEYDESKWARAAAACRDLMECEAGYELYHAPYNTVATFDRDATIDPPADGNFSTKNWPEGWADIDPYLSYRQIFDGEVGMADNPELIFTRGYNMCDDINNSITSLVAHQLPSSLNGWNAHGMTQKMVDAYYMNDGSDVPGKDSEMNGGNGSERVQGWTTAKNYRQYPPLAPNVSLQYANREPRFYASVAFNGSKWWDTNPSHTTSGTYSAVFYYRGGDNGYTNSTRYLRTGIGIKKWVNPHDYRSTNGDYDHIQRKYETAIRYADILLMYAECLNELTQSYTIDSWDGSKQYTISRDVSEIKRGIQPVRIRAGVPDYTAAEYADRDVLREKIKRERMIELMGEGKRYYDLRRWMDAQVEESKIIYGCNIMMTAAQKDDFQKIVPITSLPTTFSEKMYFWPIRKAELKRNYKLTQNPGWQYYD
ncbi:RagB/SusD family nutrient uptake outer membrane protein [Prevotella sp. E13-17]|uniref:RagB/SusD family nutrient uptake outer membrane protein n=1 Tax=Prevotella sp. E13-17 TaxID=2913616 RepID=UPI001ED9DF01|nr:RagB/SusD family nutrient uptake outer membrane protein [Prevotella sp. E13-17]UKK51665.1 RagB/SusD family nutrient uptake outer membrane protein [Prevotella sp. E13-17]